MTSKKSSADTFRFTLARTLKKHWWLVAPLFIYTFYSYPLKAIGNMMSKEIKDPETYFLLNKFFLGQSYSASSYTCVYAFLTGILLAGIIFKFVTAKKTTNVFFSLGIKRANLFAANCSAGAILLTVATAVPMLVSVIANIVYYGFSSEMIITALYLWLAPTVTGLVSFSVAACVMSRIGSVIEGLAYSTIIMFIPTFVFFTAEVLLNSFCYGSPYDQRITYYTIGENITRYVKLADTLKIGYINPLAHFMHSGLNITASLQRDSVLTDFDFTVPDFGHLIMWLAVSVAVFFIGLTLFKKRKTENAEFLGADKALTQLCSFVCAIGATALIFKYFIDESEKVFFIILGICALVLIYFICEIIVVRNFKQIVKGLWKLAIQFAVFGLVCVIFYGGAFGYSSRIPALEKIESVDISTGTSLNYIDPFASASDFYFYKDDEYGPEISAGTVLAQLSVSSYQAKTIGGFTDKADIEKAVSIHEMLIELEGVEFNEKTANGDNRVFRADIAVRYNLKNGKTVERYYSLATLGILRELIEFQNSELYFDILSEAFVLDPEEVVTGYPSGSLVENNMVGFASRNLTSIVSPKEYRMQSEKNLQLYEAIRKDIDEGNFPAYIMPDEIPMGYVVILELYEDPYSETTDKDIDIKQAKYFESFSINSHSSETIPVFESMTNTMNFIKENGLEKYFADTEKPTAARVYNCADGKYLTQESIDYFYSNNPPQFNGTNSFIQESGIHMPDNTQTITDEAEIEALLNVTNYSCSLLFDLGYVVEYEYSDGSKVYGYISQSNYN